MEEQTTEEKLKEAEEILQHEREKVRHMEHVIKTIVHGEADPKSKIEVLKDLFFKRKFI